MLKKVNKDLSFQCIDCVVDQQVLLTKPNVKINCRDPLNKQNKNKKIKNQTMEKDYTDFAFTRLCTCSRGTGDTD